MELQQPILEIYDTGRRLGRQLLNTEGNVIPLKFTLFHTRYRIISRLLSDQHLVGRGEYLVVPYFPRFSPIVAYYRSVF